MAYPPDHSGANRRERFWLRIVGFAVRRANKAGGLHHGMTKYHWTRPATPDDDFWACASDDAGRAASDSR